ncbi:MAG: hypothetical protein ACTSRW_13565 [Candidatus Helarchaeota archaeon]
MALSEPLGHLKHNENLDYLIQRAAKFRSKIPNCNVVIRYFLDQFIISCDTSTSILNLLREMDKLVNDKIPNEQLTIPYKIISYKLQILESRGEFPSEIEVDEVIEESQQIDMACKNVYEIFMGKEKCHYLGMTYKIENNSPMATMLSVGEHTILCGSIQGIKIAGLLYLINEYHDIIEKYYESI